MFIYPDPSQPPPRNVPGLPIPWHPQPLRFRRTSMAALLYAAQSIPNNLPIFPDGSQDVAHQGGSIDGGGRGGGGGRHGGGGVSRAGGKGGASRGDVAFGKGGTKGPKNGGGSWARHLSLELRCEDPELSYEAQLEAFERLCVEGEDPIEPVVDKGPAVKRWLSSLSS